MDERQWHGDLAAAMVELREAETAAEREEARREARRRTLIAAAVGFVILTVAVACTVWVVLDAQPRRAGASPMPGQVEGSEMPVDRALTVRVVALGCGGRSTGSGVVTGEGQVVTNRHVVAGAHYVEVHLHDGTRIGARVERVGADVDLAVLWAGEAVGPGRMPQGRMAPRESVRLVGHPGGGAQAVSAGPVASRVRYDEPGMRGDTAFIDAAVEPGNSGGPVFDRAGGVVGVVFGVEENTRLAVAIDGDTVAGFVAGAGMSGDPATCEPGSQ